MSLPILTTKLYIPPPRPNVVLRSRLIERMNEGLHRKLTLISAPAGSGKTTLVSEWVAACKRPAAWLSLADSDSDLTRFLTYLVAALQTIREDIGEGVLDVVQSPQPPPIDSILTMLLNSIASVADHFVLVLDDYHVIDSKPIDSVLNFLLDHLPPQMHIVIATREDPPLPLARLRARSQLTELRVADLRFMPHEAAKFLNQVMGLDLSADDISALDTRTEGWIAGLQLAALSMQGHEDVTEFIRAFAGDNRYIVDFLVEEVLRHQPERVRSFLLQTSILGRLCGPLCDVVTNQEDGNILLETLERGNLFVIPLDDKRQWYRYHHLFADVLQARLMEQQPNHVRILHIRASEWYADFGSLPEAIHHALAAEDFERAAGLIELAWSEMDKTRQLAAWVGWFKQLPEAVIQVRPVLCVGYAWAMLESGQLEAGEARLRDAEWLLENASAKMVVVDEVEFRILPATIASARAYLALADGDVDGTIQYARQALDLLHEDDHLRRGIPASLLGLASWASGNLEEAHSSFADAMNSFRIAGNILFAITGTYILADIRLAQGRLRDAISTYEQSLQLATVLGQPVLRGTADLYLRLSELLREQGDMQAASEYLAESEGLSENAALPRWPYHWSLAQARLKEDAGDLDGAIDLLNEAVRLFIRGPVPDMRPVAASKARVWIAQGRLSEALTWAREQGLSVDDDLSYVREFEHITLARVLIAKYKNDGDDDTIDAALNLIERLLRAAEAVGRMGSVIEILVVETLAHEAQGDSELALEALKQALILAEPEGYIRIFVDEGTPMEQLLSEVAAQGLMTDYVNKLLAAFEGENQARAGDTAYLAASASQLLVEPLSQRELEVLRLVADGLSNREISERLFLALDTVKGHNRRIFGKLQVQRRTEAVARARELGLLNE